jgi:hypothetical protein
MPEPYQGQRLAAACIVWRGSTKRQNALAQSWRRAPKAAIWQPTAIILYCSIALAETPMSHHHHHGDAPHPSAAAGPSLLRLSASQRLALAGIIIGLLWAAFWWAVR